MVRVAVSHVAESQRCTPQHDVKNGSRTFAEPSRDISVHYTVSCAATLRATFFCYRLGVRVRVFISRVKSENRCGRVRTVQYGLSHRTTMGHHTVSPHVRNCTYRSCSRGVSQRLTECVAVVGSEQAGHSILE